DSENSSTSAGGGGSGGGAQQQQRYRNALGEGLVVPGLDGVIYSLGANGKLSVLTSSAPDLVLEPRMACLAVNADSDGGIVEDESCGLLIGEKTTELFSLDTETGTARRVGGGGGAQSRPGREAGDGGRGRGGKGWGPTEQWGQQEEEDDEGGSRDGGPWEWGGYDSRRNQQQQQQQQPHRPPPNSNLLLQRDEYVVRALDAETSEELWYVTVAHFSALDLQGRGGATALTRAKVAAADREGYTRVIRARSGSSSSDDDDTVKALPLPIGGDDDEWDSSSSSSSSSSWSSSKDWERDIPHGAESGGGKQTRRRGKFGEEHADRFPYLLYEDNAYVVAMDPMDGSVLWRKEMPALAVSLYGIRGREWVDILPPPMSMLRPPPGSYPGAATTATTSLMPAASVVGGGGSDDWLAGEEVDWSHQQDEGRLLLLTNGDDDDLTTAAATAETAAAAAQDWASVSSDGDADSVSSISSSSSSSASEDDDADVTWDASSTLDDPGAKAVVPAAVTRLPGARGSGGGGKGTGLLQPGLRNGHLQAQVGFLNGHFFVSSSLRRGPLHAAAVEDLSTTAQDRYPHPLGMASRRSFVDAAGRDARDVGGDLGGGSGGGIAAGLVQMPPPVVKVPPQAARPVDQTGVRVGAANGNDAVSGAGGGAGGGGGGGGGGTAMGIGDWRQALLEGVEKAMIEERRSKYGMGGEDTAAGDDGGLRQFLAGGVLHPGNEGLFMSWGLLAALVGGLVAIVAGVAYLAYKHGATAMANMTTITRRAGSATKLGRNGSPDVVVTGDDRKRPAGAGPARERSLFGGVSSPGEEVPLPAMATSPSLQQRASASAMFTGPGPNGSPAAGGEGRGSLGRSSPTAGVLQRARSMHEVHIQRVHSLPALRQSHSPPGHGGAAGGGRCWHPRQGWHPLFGSEEGAPDGAAANGDAAGVQLSRAVSAATAHEGGGKVVVGSGGGNAERLSSTTGLDEGQVLAALEGLDGGSPSSATSGARTSEISPRAESGVGGGPPARKIRKDSSSAASSSSRRRALEAVAVPRSSGRRRRRRRQGSGSRGSGSRRESEEDDGDSDGEEEEKEEEEEEEEEQDDGSGERRQPRARRNCSRDISPDDDDDGGGGGSDWEGGSGRRRVETDHPTTAGRARDRGGSRRPSRSPRASAGSGTEGEEGELVLGAGVGCGSVGCGGGEDNLASAIVDTGGDDKDALLVTNRRLRTEFVEGQKLGKGGFGTVFKCRNRLDGHDYAVKKIRLSSDPRWQPQLAKVLREVKIMSLLDHPNIVRYYQASFACAWLEKFTEEDEELLREEGAPSAVSESWDQTTGGGGGGGGCSRASHIPQVLHHRQHQHQVQHTGTGMTAAGSSSKTKTYAYANRHRGGSGRGGNLDDGLGGLGCLGFGASPPQSPLFVMPDGLGKAAAVAAAPAAAESNDIISAGGGGGGGEHRYTPKVSGPLFEEQSVDGWSVDSRSADGRGNSGGGGGRSGLGRRAWGDVSFYEREYHEEEGEEGGEGGDDDDDASMPGFVFEREEAAEDGNRVEEEEEEEEEGGGEEDGWLVGVSGHEDGDDDGGDDGGDGGDDDFSKKGTCWTAAAEGRRPSGSVSAAATASASAYAEGEGDGCCSDGKADTNDLYAPPPPPPSCRSNGGGTAKEEGEEGSANCDGGGEERGNEEEDSDSSHDGRGHGSNHDDDSFSWNRVRPLPPGDDGVSGAAAVTGPNGQHQHRHPGGGGDPGSSPPPPATLELALSDVPRRRSPPATIAEKEQDRRHRSRAGNRSDGEGKVAAAAIAAEAAEGKSRPRGQSWPIAAAADVGGNAALAGGDADGEPGAGAGARKRRTRSSAAAAFPEAAATASTAAATSAAAAAAASGSNRRRNFGKGAWDKEQQQARGGGRGGRRRSKEVYDLWLYIQMQYCSHNNLQFFLDEDPVRRSQTRVDMPQVMHIFMQVAKGLQYVHACGLIHRDLKPANCFLMRDGAVKIGDFGLSRHILPADGINAGAVSAVADAAAAAAAATAAATEASSKKRASFAWESDHHLGGVGGDEAITGGVGTYLYASPEQMSGKGYDEKTDMFSLGMLMFELCHPPFG
ncbi:unnamed protein product, partial [Ectocarpus fasciculatus]